MATALQVNNNTAYDNVPDASNMNFGIVVA